MDEGEVDLAFCDVETVLAFLSTVVGRTYSLVSTARLFTTSPVDGSDFPEAVETLLKLSERRGAFGLTPAEPALFIVLGYALERAEEEFNEFLCPL